MNVKELREALAKLGPEHDAAPLVIWLPGSRIDTHNWMGILPQRSGATSFVPTLMIEGSVRAGSALDNDAVAMALASALREQVGSRYDLTNLICHEGLCTPEKCGRCSRQMRAWDLLEGKLP